MFNSSTMSHVALALFVLFSCLSMVSAAPIAAAAELAKRTDHVGRGTWFYPGKGNCGYVDGNNDKILAMAKSFYDANGGSNCNQWVEIVNEGNGKSAYGLLRDSCESCGWNDIDMSPGLFEELDDLSTGELTVKWHFMAKSWSP
ncbi:riboflavin aldehyde-forming enzyme [Armillaria borealis]|uniref:Riboflavin aldehyde-forming enzyme n=2 Tax=Armillaria TaxID=47424 RepID=A0AA39JBS7_9AGAR|nr:riboflavin aldehyde-forming enzyme [Armillaria borealis]